MILRIHLYDESVLREKGETITEFDDKLKSLVEDMFETMHLKENNSVGIAAQQIGRALRLCVIDIYDIPDKHGFDITVELDGKEVPYKVLFPLAVINPEITPIGDEVAVQPESCMSLPGIYPNITRHEKICLKYQDVEGNAHEIVTNNYFARVIQHEVDHTNGILTIDRVDRRALNAMGSKLKQLKRYTRDMLKKLAKGGGE